MDEDERMIAVEIEARLLKRLRALHPGKSDREVIEHVARADLRTATIRQSQERNALAEDDAIELGVRAIHDARRGPS